MTERGRTRRAVDALAIVAAVALIHLVVILPNHPGAMTPGALRVFSLETPALVAVLVAARGIWAPRLAVLVAAWLTAILLVKLADLAVNVAFLREFNPALDLHLIPAGWHMLSGAIGSAPAAGLLALAALALLAVVVALGLAARRLSRVDPPPMASAVTVGLLALVAVDRVRPADVNPPGISFNLRLAAEHVRDVGRARADLARFREAAAEDPASGRHGGALLARLAGRDVLIIFVESYGRTALTNPRYADVIGDRLERIEDDLAAAGLAARSAYLTSPVAGGQSWLSHATLLSGLWIDTQGRYQALMASPRRTLLHLARDAGWSTAAVMPAITLDWPDSAYFGYDSILAAADLGYGGPPFNWVTMPDQFTLASFERSELGPGPRRPVFAEIALISSHAPWTPVPEIVPWETIGDGAGFAQFLDNGPPAETLWRDRSGIRDQYREALDYALSAAGAFAVRRAPAQPLIVIVGDHQPASFVSEAPDDRAVPIHLIGPPELLEAIDPWSWRSGMRPAESGPVWRMDAFRDRFLEAYSAPGPEARAEVAPLSCAEVATIHVGRAPLPSAPSC